MSTHCIYIHSLAKELCDQLQAMFPVLELGIPSIVEYPEDGCGNFKVVYHRVTINGLARICGCDDQTSLEIVWVMCLRVDFVPHITVSQQYVGQWMEQYVGRVAAQKPYCYHLLEGGWRMRYWLRLEQSRYLCVVATNTKYGTDSATYCELDHPRFDAQHSTPVRPSDNGWNNLW